ncbi:hypothetical protein [Streptomyces sp. NPDC002067]
MPHAYPKLLDTGRSSVRIEVEAYTERMRTALPMPASRARPAFVAVDEANRPRPSLRPPAHAVPAPC